MIYVQRFSTANEWAEGAWAEVLKVFDALEWRGEPVDHRVLVQPPNGKFVQGREDLTKFKHPEGGATLYMFGPDDGHLTEEPALDHSVFIPQSTASVTLWSHQAAAVVLWDRNLKHGDS